ncbi:hypothetical protein [Enterococcus sp. 12E11_DIV0728]|uniref:hypothetical protein n=1 Tax=Enterococcus sp. 12E11_DIV0728 TaxID=1834168 RepID=UPI000A33F112|nr:hypothetical protein [Enterococcus sp. 12E11_DIV0728]OTO71627.1 hypothetical protein A5865_002290 [Enterococcus sp. 12E11_DIV0728]
MELKTQVQQHEDKLKQHDKEISRLNERSLAMQKTMDESLIRVDESNKYLREQNTEQMKQNNEILNAILTRNTDAEKRSDELKRLNTENLWKMILGIGGSAAVIFAFIMELLKFLGGR